MVSAIFIIFIAIFCILSLQNIPSTPLLEFDGAHRAESAKQMRINHEYLAPLDGSPFLRNTDLRLQISNKPAKYP